MVQIRTFLIIVCSVFISACSTLPEPLVSENESIVTDYQQWLSLKPDAEAEVRLGGMIAGVTNFADKSRIEIVNMPINSVGKPNLNAEPHGRYVVYVDGFIEPMTYSPGRLITVLGQSAGEEKGKVGEFDYRFRVLNASGLYLWTIRESVVVDDFDSYLFPCRSGLHCRSLRMSTSTGRVIQDVE